MMILLFLILINNNQTIESNNIEINSLYEMIFRENYSEAISETKKLIDYDKTAQINYIVLCDAYIAQDEINRTNSNKNKILAIHKILDTLLSKEVNYYINSLLILQKIYIAKVEMKYFDLYKLNNLFVQSIKNAIINNDHKLESEYLLQNYYYWRSKSIPIIYKSNESELIVSAERLTKANSYLKLISEYNMIWYYYSVSNYTEMINLALQLSQKYPENIELLWALMSAYEMQHKVKELKNVLEYISKSENNKSTSYRYLVSNLKLAKIFKKENNNTISKVYLEKIINFNTNNSIIGYNERLNEAKLLYKQVNDN